MRGRAVLAGMGKLTADHTVAPHITTKCFARKNHVYAARDPIKVDILNAFDAVLGSSIVIRLTTHGPYASFFTSHRAGTDELSVPIPAPKMDAVHSKPRLPCSARSAK